MQLCRWPHSFKALTLWLACCFSIGEIYAVPFSQTSCCNEEVDYLEEHTEGLSRHFDHTVDPHNDIWQRVRSQLDFSRDLHRSIVRSELSQLVQHLPSLYSNLQRAEPYLYYIIQEVERRGFPIEIALLPFVESHFSPYATSSYGASGLWQFMPSTARYYNIPINWWYDGRRDLVDSTSAALDYLGRLNRLFNGDWLLAIAAYNAGPSRVQSQIKEFGKRNLKQEYWALDLPRDTRRYVPMLLALCEIISWGVVNGQPLPSIANSPAVKIIRLPGQMDTIELAQAAGMSIEDLYTYNAGLSQWASPPKGPHRVLIPTKNYDEFLKNSANFDKKIVAWDTYRIKPGDSIGSISELFAVDPAILRQLNNMVGSNDFIRAGQHLLVPNIDNSLEAFSNTEATKNDVSALSELSEGSVVLDRPIPTRGGTLRYTIKQGESIALLSRKLGIQEQNLQAQLGSQTIQPGYPVVINLGPTLPQKIQRPKSAHYRVRNGDTLTQIASRFGVTVQDLMQLNEMSSATLYPGSELSIPIFLEP